MPRKSAKGPEFRGKLGVRHKKVLDLVASGMSQAAAARKVGFSPVWVSCIINTSEDARKYLEASRDIIMAKHRLLAEGAVNENLRAMFQEELGLTDEEKAKLAVSKQMAVQAGMSQTTARIAGMIDEPGAQPPAPISLRVNVLQMLRDPEVAAHALAAANEAAAKGILVMPREG